LKGGNQVEKVKAVTEQSFDREQFLAEYFAPHSKSKRPSILTKREKKKFGIGKDEGRATVNHYRLSSRKVRIVLNLIKNKNLDEAYGIVKYTPKAASEVIYKLLKSAEANAVNNNGLDRDSLYVTEAFANQGVTLKRMMPRARGSANRILKRTSHITVVLKEKK
jgi:large subunit ribosomal protein L22